jgi:threonine dehydrogenase-like Zn-dependent dehydrogenase
MTETCQAAVFLGNDRYEIREFAVPDPPPGGAVLRVEAVGLCGSDVAQFHGVELVPGASVFPVVPGHETVGRVVKLAPDAALGVQEGDRVAVDEILSQGPSGPAERGEQGPSGPAERGEQGPSGPAERGALPPFRIYGYSDMTGEGNVGLWGGYGEYMEIFAGTKLHRLTDRYPAEQLTLFEPLANAVNWVERAGVGEGDTVVVQGPGHQGLAVLEAVLAKKPGRVIVTGTSHDSLRLDAARAIGATDIVVVDVDDPVKVVGELTGGQMADVVMDIASVVQTVPLCIDLVKWNGRILLAGLKHYAPIPNLVTDMIVMKSLTVVGGSGFTPQSMARAVEMLESGEAKSDLVLGEVFPLDGIDEAMGLLARTDPSRDAVRVGIKHRVSGIQSGVGS